MLVMARTRSMIALLTTNSCPTLNSDTEPCWKSSLSGLSSRKNCGIGSWQWAVGSAQPQQQQLFCGAAGSLFRRGKVVQGRGFGGPNRLLGPLSAAQRHPSATGHVPHQPAVCSKYNGQQACAPTSLSILVGHQPSPGISPCDGIQ